MVVEAEADAEETFDDAETLAELTCEVDADTLALAPPLLFELVSEVVTDGV